MDLALVEMSAMFPKGIRTLIVDNNTKFLRSATQVLSALNCEAVTCSSVIHALKQLTTGNLKGFDVILVHAEKAAACGFDFRGIVEADLCIPVVYFLSPDHKATGEEADELLGTLEGATYIIKTPLDPEEVRTRLWGFVAWHKCSLETKASRVTGDKRAVAAAYEAGSDAEGEDEDCVHYKVVRGERNPKRKGGGSNPSGGSSSGTTATAAGHHPGKGKEKDNVEWPARQKQSRDKKGKMNDSGEAFKQLGFFQQPNKAINNGDQRQQPKPSLFMQSVLDIPPYNPKFCTDAAWRSSNGAVTFAAAASSSNTAAPAAPHPVYSSAPPALPPAALSQQQQHATHNVVFGNIAPPAAVATMAAATATYEPLQFSRGGNQQQQHVVHNVIFGNMAPPAAVAPKAAATATYEPPQFSSFGNKQQPAAHNVVFGNITPPATVANMAVATVTYETQFSSGLGNQDLQDVRPLPLMFGPFPYQGPPLPVVQQDMVIPVVAGGIFSGNMTVGASAAAKDMFAPSAADGFFTGSMAGGGGMIVGTSAAAEDMFAPWMEVVACGFFIGGMDGGGGMTVGALDAIEDMVAPAAAGGIFTGGMAGGGDTTIGALAGAKCMVAPAAAGGLFTGGMAGGGTTVGASGAAATGAGAYGYNEASSFLQAPNLSIEKEGDEELAGMLDMYNSMADPPVTPQHVGVASDEAAMLASLSSDDFDDYIAGSSPVAPDDQVLGMPWNVNELTAMAGGAFGHNNAASFVTPHDLGIAANGGSGNGASFLAPQDLGVAANGGSSNAASFIAPHELSVVLNVGSSNAALFMAPHMDLNGWFMAPQDLRTMSNGGSSKAAPFMAPHQDLGASFMAPHQDLGASFMAPRDLGTASNGGSSSNNAPFMAPQDLGAAPNGDQLAPDHNIYGSLMGSQGQDPGEAMDGDNGLTAAMLAPDQHEDNTLFPIEDQYEDNAIFPFEALLDVMHSPMLINFDADLDAQLGSDAATDAAGNDMDNLDIGNAINGLDIPTGDWLFGNTGDFMFLLE